MCDETGFIGGGAYNCIRGCASDYSLYQSSNAIVGGSYNRICCNSKKVLLVVGIVIVFVDLLDPLLEVVMEMLLSLPQPP